MAKVWSVITFILFSLAGFSSSFAQGENTVETLLWKIKPATVLIYVEIKAEITVEKDKYPAGMGNTGSGFVISPDGYVVTNGHVVENYHESNEKSLKAQLLTNDVIPKIILKMEAERGNPYSETEKQEQINKLLQELLQKAQFQIEKQLYVILQSGESFPAEVKSYSPPLTPIAKKAGKGYAAIGEREQKTEAGKDVAVLKIEATNLPVAQLGDSEGVRLAEPVYIVGFPGVVLYHDYLGQKTIFDPTVTTGKVSGAKLDVKGTKVIQTDASTTWGNSGGPAYNASGAVIGILTFGSLATPPGGKELVPIQGFNFLVPINTAKEFVRTAGVELGKESLFNKVWAETIDLYAQGQYKDAISKAEVVLRFIPNLPDARKLQVRAQTEIEKGSGKGRLPYYTAIILVIVLAGGALAYVLQRKRAPVTTTHTKVIIPPGAKIVGRIVGKGGPLSGKSFDIPSTGLKIGRDAATNNLVIDDERVSREHLWIGPEGAKMLARDLNSLNGTYLNNPDSNRIKEEALKDGDVIIIGRGNFVSFVYRTS